MLRIGIDLGGTKIEGIVADDDLKAVVRRRIPTHQSEGYQAIITRLADFIKQLEGEAGADCPVGICTPGSLSPRSGLMRNSNTVCLNQRPLKKDLERTLGREVAMENDANCFALAEALLGAGRGHSCVFGVIMGTGVGGGIVLEGGVRSGRLLIAGEWGHQKLYPGGNPCYCGQKGCVETYLSGPALERRWKDLGGPSLNLPEIVSQVEADPEDPRSKQWKSAFLTDFGLALSNVVNVVDPDVVVLGGGVSKISFLYDKGLDALLEYVFSDYCDTPVRENQLGDSAGVFGAACLTMEDRSWQSENAKREETGLGRPNADKKSRQERFAKKRQGRNMHAHPADQAEWWKKGIVYQIYPMSFQDSTGNGKGDLKGIERRLDYVQQLGVQAVWLSPIYPSPMHDNGYDVADYCDINPLFGTLRDFDRLLEKLHDRGLKLIIDLVPNHTSDEHPWFVESRSSRNNPKRDWYTWADPKPDGSPPNNWLSLFGGPAWTLDRKAGQYYLHQFVTQQPELNYRNPQVLEAMQENMRFWLRRGVDGFRVDVIWLMQKDEQLRDEPLNPDWDGGDPHGSLIHCHTQDVEGIHDLVRAFRGTLEEFEDRYMVGEIYLPLERLVSYYGKDLDECHQPFNFHLIETPWSASAVRDMVERYESLLPPGGWPNYVASNHDRHRSASRVEPRQARCANMLLLTLRGTPTVYYGEELGLENVPIPREKWNDPIARLQPEHVEAMARDQVRAPMIWNRGPNGGFCPPSVEPWLPLPDNHGRLSVEAQQGDAASHLALFRQLARLRQSETALNLGSYRTLAVETPGVYAYERLSPPSDRLAVCLNFDSEAKTADLSREAERAEIVLSTQLDRSGPAGLSRLKLRADEGLILRLRD